MEEKDIQENVEVTQADNKPYQVKIEEARKTLFSSYTKQRRISNIIMFVVLAAIVGVMFMVMSNIQWLKIVGYSLGGAILVGMILYYVLTRKNFPNKTKEYITMVSNILREQQFGSNYSNIKYDLDEKFAITDFASDGVYKDATSINSRNIVRAEYKGHHVTYGEVALLRPSTRKQQVPPLFVGKYITLPNDLDFSGRFVIVMKNPKQPFDLPNAVEDLTVLEEKEDMVVYGPEGADIHKTLKGSFLTDLRRIRVDNHLFNVNVVVWGGHSAAYLSYDDAIMAIPFDKPFDQQAYDQSFADVNAIIKLLAGE
ncbi:MAG: hypothetical protein J6N95_06890 [Bacilli bacterium]|nr:hypothetical protein [Bacilli bacterium]